MVVFYMNKNLIDTAVPSVLLLCKLYVHSFHVNYFRPRSNHYIYICQQMLMAFQLLGIYLVSYVCLNTKWFVNKGKRQIFF